LPSTSFNDLPAEQAELNAAVVRTLTWRLVPFLFLLYIVAYLDRINLGFAALQMQRQLGFTDLMYGLGAGIFFAGYFLIMGPTFIITLMVIFFSLRREGRIVRQFLYPDYQRGFFDQLEYERLATIRGRMGLSWAAMANKGFAGWRARRRYNQIASELAFHRSRVARGFAKDPTYAQQRENDYLYTLLELRQKLGMTAPSPGPQ